MANFQSNQCQINSTLLKGLRQCCLLCCSSVCCWLLVVAAVLCPCAINSLVVLLIYYKVKVELNGTELATQGHSKKVSSMTLGVGECSEFGSFSTNDTILFPTKALPVLRVRRSHELDIVGNYY